jgi:hypothetical protein
VSIYWLPISSLSQVKFKETLCNSPAVVNLTLKQSVLFWAGCCKSVQRQLRRLSRQLHSVRLTALVAGQVDRWEETDLILFSFLFWFWHIPNFDDRSDPEETAIKGGGGLTIDHVRVAFGTRGPPCDGILIMTRTCWGGDVDLHSVCLTEFAATVPCTSTEKLVRVSTGLYAFLNYSLSYYSIANPREWRSLPPSFPPSLPPSLDQDRHRFLCYRPTGYTTHSDWRRRQRYDVWWHRAQWCHRTMFQWWQRQWRHENVLANPL